MLFQDYAQEKWDPGAGDPTWGWAGGEEGWSGLPRVLLPAGPQVTGVQS